MPTDQVTLLVTAIATSAPVIVGGLMYATERSQLKNERITGGVLALVALGLAGWSGYELALHAPL